MILVSAKINLQHSQKDLEEIFQLKMQIKMTYPIILLHFRKRFFIHLLLLNSKVTCSSRYLGIYGIWEADEQGQNDINQIILSDETQLLRLAVENVFHLCCVKRYRLYFVSEMFSFQEAASARKLIYTSSVEHSG